MVTHLFAKTIPTINPISVDWCYWWITSIQPSRQQI